MKKILLGFIVAICITSCKEKSIGDKLQEKVESNEKANANFEHYNIDSFRYSLGTIQDYYISLVDQYDKDVAQQKEIRQDARVISYDSLIVITSHNILLSVSKRQFLNNLLFNADKSIKVYIIDYYEDYQTDKSNFKGHKTAFLYPDNLYEVHVDIDSLYKQWPESIKGNYDKYAEIKIMEGVEKKEIQKDNLKDELELKIASGTNIDVILNYRLRISTLDKDIAQTESDYWYLYD